MINGLLECGEVLLERPLSERFQPVLDCLIHGVQLRGVVSFRQACKNFCGVAAEDAG